MRPRLVIDPRSVVYAALAVLSLCAAREAGAQEARRRWETQCQIRKDKFDYILIETTGLADPGPVAQTFFMDDDVHKEYLLDAVVTVVDAKHGGRRPPGIADV